MKPLQILILLTLSIFCCFSPELNAQECPAPENLSIQLDFSTQPPTAHVSWTVPPGSNVTGFIFTYSLDGGAQTVLNLPSTPTEYNIILPFNWEQLDIELVSVCKDGSISRVSRTKTANIIILDLVLTLHDGAEQIVCNKPCQGSSHFYYSQGSGLNNAASIGLNDAPISEGPVESEGDETSANGPVVTDGSTTLEIFRNATFCTCMFQHGGNYQDQTVVDVCRYAAREYVTMSPYLNFCRASSGRSANSGQNAESRVFWYPNPVSNELFIEVDAIGTRCVITDITGQMMMELSPIDLNTSIAVSDWKPGIYFIRTTDQKGEVSVGKFVKI